MAVSGMVRAGAPQFKLWSGDRLTVRDAGTGTGPAPATPSPELLPSPPPQPRAALCLSQLRGGSWVPALRASRSPPLPALRPISVKDPRSLDPGTTSRDQATPWLEGQGRAVPVFSVLGVLLGFGGGREEAGRQPAPAPRTQAPLRQLRAALGPCAGLWPLPAAGFLMALPSTWTALAGGLRWRRRPWKELPQVAAGEEHSGPGPGGLAGAHWGSHGGTTGSAVTDDRGAEDRPRAITAVPQRATLQSERRGQSPCVSLRLGLYDAPASSLVVKPGQQAGWPHPLTPAATLPCLPVCCSQPGHTLQPRSLAGQWPLGVSRTGLSRSHPALKSPSVQAGGKPVCPCREGEVGARGRKLCSPRRCLPQQGICGAGTTLWSPEAGGPALPRNQGSRHRATGVGTPGLPKPSCSALLARDHPLSRIEADLASRDLWHRAQVAPPGVQPRFASPGPDAVPEHRRPHVPSSPHTCDSPAQRGQTPGRGSAPGPGPADTLKAFQRGLADPLRRRRSRAAGTLGRRHPRPES